MRTTVDIDEDVLEEAKEVARVRRMSVGKVLSDMWRRSRKNTAKFEVVDGIPVLPWRGGAPVVTLEMVNELRDGDS